MNVQGSPFIRIPHTELLEVRHHVSQHTRQRRQDRVGDTRQAHRRLRAVQQGETCAYMSASKRQANKYVCWEMTQDLKIAVSCHTKNPRQSRPRHTSHVDERHAVEAICPVWTIHHTRSRSLLFAATDLKLKFRRLPF